MSWYHVCRPRNSDCHTHTSGVGAGSNCKMTARRAFGITSTRVLAMEVHEEGVEFPSLEVGNIHSGPTVMACLSSSFSQESRLLESVALPFFENLIAWLVIK